MIPGLFVFAMTTSVRHQHRAPDASAAVAEVAPLDLEASADRLDQFPQLIQALGAATPTVRQALAKEINDVLVAMRFPGHESEESELVMQALGSKVLHGLVDAQGRSCRKEAVETMMAAGFPHALLLEPDDIAFARQYRPATSHERRDESQLQPWELSARDARRTGAGIIVASQLITAVLLAVFGASVGVWVAMALAFVSALFLAGRLALVRPRELNLATTGTLGFFTLGVPLLVAAFANLGVASVASWGLGIGLFVAITQQFAPRADPPRPGDWDFPPDRDLW